MPNPFFPQRSQANPTIYAYELMGVSTHAGWLKVGYTNRNAKDRIAEQLKTSRVKYKIVLDESAMRPDGSAFTGYDVHSYLRSQDMTESWTDEKLYRKYGLTAEEIDFIEAMIRPME